LSPSAATSSATSSASFSASFLPSSSAAFSQAGCVCCARFYRPRSISFCPSGRRRFDRAFAPRRRILPTRLDRHVPPRPSILRLSKTAGVSDFQTKGDRCEPCSPRRCFAHDAQLFREGSADSVASYTLVSLRE